MALLQQLLQAFDYANELFNYIFILFFVLWALCPVIEPVERYFPQLDLDPLLAILYFLQPHFARHLIIVFFTSVITVLIMDPDQIPGTILAVLDLEDE